MQTDTDNVSQSSEPQPESVSRRQFLTKLSLGLSGLLGALVGVPVLGFLVEPLVRKAPLEWQPVGPVSKFKVGETVQITLRDPSPLPWSGVTARAAAWLRRETEQEFVCFAVNCTHLGCPVRWLPDANIFMCPCHGGVFYRDGRVAAGPPPRPLFRYPVRIQNGQVEVRSGELPIAG